MNKGIFLSTMELKIILYKKKIDGIMVFEELTGEITSELEVKEALESLISNKYLIPKGEAFSFSDEIEEIMGVLEQATYCYKVRSFRDRIPAICMYRANELSLIMQLDIRSKDMIRLEVFKGDDAIWFLADSDYMPSFSGKGAEAKRVDYVSLQEKFEESASRLLIERYQRGCFDVDRQILVSEGDISDEIYLEESGKLFSYPFTAEAFRELITEEKQ